MRRAALLLAVLVTAGGASATIAWKPVVVRWTFVRGPHTLDWHGKKATTAISSATTVLEAQKVDHRTAVLRLTIRAHAGVRTKVGVQAQADAHVIEKDIMVIGAVQSRRLAFAPGTSTVRLTLKLQVPSDPDLEQELCSVSVYVVDDVTKAVIGYPTVSADKLDPGGTNC